MDPTAFYDGRESTWEDPVATRVRHKNQNWDTSSRTRSEAETGLGREGSGQLQGTYQRLWAPAAYGKPT